MLVFHHCILYMLTHISRWWLISVVIHSHCTELLFKETVFLPPIVQYPHSKTIYNIKVWVWNENDALNEGVYQISLLSFMDCFWNGRKDSSFRELIMDRTNDIWTCNHSIQCKSLFHIRSSCRKHWLIACEVPFHFTSGCHIVVGKTNFVLQTWSIANSSHNSSYDWSYTTLIHVINLRPRWSLLNPRP